MTRREFEKMISEYLNLLSFKKRKGLFFKHMDENTAGTLGFVITSGHIPGVLSVNPVVGIFYKPVEELYSKLKGLDFVNIFTPIITCPLGYLTPSHTYIEWVYSDNHSADETNANLLNAIKLYGLHFIEKYSNQDELLRCLEDRKYILHIYRDYKLPILYYLRGEKQKGLVTIEKSIERQKESFDESSLFKFSSAFKEEITIASGLGEVDPLFIKFVEKYKAL